MATCAHCVYSEWSFFFQTEATNIPYLGDIHMNNFDMTEETSQQVCDIDFKGSLSFTLNIYVPVILLTGDE